MSRFQSIEEFKGRYTIGQRIGEGGFGKVYKAYDTSSDRHFAIKISEVNPDKTKYRLAHEVVLAAKLEHPNIARYESCHTFLVENEMKDYALMQYYPMGNLDDYLSNNKVSEAQKADLVKGILAGVQYLHEQKIVHRDLKAHNILVVVRKDGTIVPKISDFGISRSFETGKQSGFINTTSAGTVEYSSPEQLAGAKTLRPNTDLWSVGILIYRIFNGKTPFYMKGDSSQVQKAEMIRRITEGVLPTDIDKVPLPFYEVMRRCLVVNPDDRIRSAAECLGILNEVRSLGTPTIPTETMTIVPKNWWKNYVIKLNLWTKFQKWKITIGVTTACLLVMMIWKTYTSFQEPNNYFSKARAYATGVGTKKNLEKAFVYYQLSAENGYPVALGRIGLLYISGKGTQKDTLKGLQLVKEALPRVEILATNGDEHAQLLLGVCYENGRGVVKDEKKAVEWYTKAAEQEDADAQWKLGVCYEDSIGVVKNEKKAVEWYTKAAEQGNANAQWSLGLCYQYGRGVVKDEKKAVEWYSKAAEQENAHAQYNLGYYYQYSTGVVKDEKKAVVWYTKAAEQGNDAAQWSLGVCYENGTGVVKDEKKAVEWYTKAAEQGNAHAQWSLGICYQYGTGVVKDEKKAVEWYTKAAEQGDAGTQNILGICYQYGTGVVKDGKKAVEWYTKAAEQGDTDALYNLGWCYQNGTGIVKDEKKAVEWYKKAAVQGNEDAKHALKRLGY